MNVLAPVFVGMAAAVPILVIAVYVARHPRPDAARLKVLRDSLFLVLALTIIQLLFEIRNWISGKDSPAWTLVQLTSYASLVASILISIRHCRKRLGKRRCLQDQGGGPPD